VKVEANAFFTKLGVPSTFLQTTFFYEAFLAGGQGPHRDQNRGFLAVSSGFGDQVSVVPAWRVDEGVMVSLGA
jgi:hypothetical protein